jgi:hypothetical protein
MADMSENRLFVLVGIVPTGEKTTQAVAGFTTAATVDEARDAAQDRWHVPRECVNAEDVTDRVREWVAENPPPCTAPAGGGL